MNGVLVTLCFFRFSKKNILQKKKGKRLLGQKNKAEKYNKKTVYNYIFFLSEAFLHYIALYVTLPQRWALNIFLLCSHIKYIA